MSLCNTDMMTEDWLQLGRFSVGCQGATTVLTSSRMDSFKFKQYNNNHDTVH